MPLSHPVHAAFDRDSQLMRSVLRDHDPAEPEGTLCVAALVLAGLMLPDTVRRAVGSGPLSFVD
jgi:hypothetical protein